jgi:hypothetical protein
MTGTNCKSHWSFQSSLPITAPVHKPIFKIAHPTTSSPYNFFAPQYLFLHIIICTSFTPVLMLNCNYFATMAYLLPYLPSLTIFAHTVYSFFYCVIDCTFIYPMCNTVLLLSHCFALSWPGSSCKWQLVLNWPTWLNIFF